jgi:hypothetical protein
MVVASAIARAMIAQRRNLRRRLGGRFSVLIGVLLRRLRLGAGGRGKRLEESCE